LLPEERRYLRDEIDRRRRVRAHKERGIVYEVKTKAKCQFISTAGTRCLKHSLVGLRFCSTHLDSNMRSSANNLI